MQSSRTTMLRDFMVDSISIKNVNTSTSANSNVVTAWLKPASVHLQLNDITIDDWMTIDNLYDKDGNCRIKISTLSRPILDKLLELEDAIHKICDKNSRKWFNSGVKKEWVSIIKEDKISIKLQLNGARSSVIWVTDPNQQILSYRRGITTDLSEGAKVMVKVRIWGVWFYEDKMGLGLCVDEIVVFST